MEIINQSENQENKTKNIFVYVLDGIKEGNGQDSYYYLGFGFEVDNRH
jgi:hypothetical protein